MKDIIKDYLFSKSIFVKEDAEVAENQPEVVYTLAKLFNIVLSEGASLAMLSFVKLAARMLGHYVWPPFYVGFPESVKELSKGELLVDQLWHYYNTYGQGNFAEPGHSVLEKPVVRKLFSEKTPIKYFRALSESAAIEEAKAAAQALLAGTRPLSVMQYGFVCAVIDDYGLVIEKIASKQTAVSLLLDKGEILPYAKGLWVSDTVKVVESLLYRSYRGQKINALSLKTRDKKLLCRLLDYFFENGRDNLKACCEKRATLVGILHHIHYKPKNERAEAFLIAIRGKEKKSTYSAFEAKLQEGDAVAAAALLKKEKGDTALLRSLFYLISRAKTEEEIAAILNMPENPQPIALWQLLLKTVFQKQERGGRTFAFTRNNLRVSHTETDEERRRRKSLLPAKTVDAVKRVLREKLALHYKGKLGRVYIDPDMKNVALPLEESTSMGGFGTLPTGSVAYLPPAKKLRAFVYWEKVDDIDFSCIGLSERAEVTEFSWRTMYFENGNGLLFSGDQTSGYKGGSEYFDLDVPLYRQRHPEVRYLVFCGNVFSRTPFRQCVCRAGYMERDEAESGEIFEPKTVKTSFAVSADSTEAYFFAFDLKKNRLVWLNKGVESSYIIAAEGDKRGLIRYMQQVDHVNLYGFFSMLATSCVKSPERAEVVVSDKELSLPEGVLQIRSSDMDKVVALLNS